MKKQNIKEEGIKEKRKLIWKTTEMNEGKMNSEITKWMKEGMIKEKSKLKMNLNWDEKGIKMNKLKYIKKMKELEIVQRNYKNDKWKY